MHPLTLQLLHPYMRTTHSVASGQAKSLYVWIFRTCCADTIVPPSPKAVLISDSQCSIMVCAVQFLMSLVENTSQSFMVAISFLFASSCPV